MKKYRCLDLCCAGGGASFGYEQAGFEVTGVDIEFQPKYKSTFFQEDAIEFLKRYHHDYDFFHASPPCQEYSLSTKQFRMKGKQYPQLISQLRTEFIKIGKPYVIENVPGSPLLNPIMLCGTMFGLPTYRHRLFESNVHLFQPMHEKHLQPNCRMGRKPKSNEFIQYVGHFSGIKIVQKFTGLHWLGQKELAQSIPPQYTYYIGLQIINHLKCTNF